MFDRLKEWFDTLGQRERKLAVIFGAVVVLTLVVWITLTVNDGLRSLEDRNAQVSNALKTLDEKRDQILDERGRPGDATAQIPTEALSLGPYLEKAGSESGVQIRAQSEQPVVTKGKFHEMSNQITLFDVTLDQLAQFLKRIEAQATVVTQRLLIKRSTIAKEKMDRVEITVSTYERTKEKLAKGEAKEAADAGK